MLLSKRRAEGLSPKLTLLMPRRVWTPGHASLMRLSASSVSMATRRSSSLPVQTVLAENIKVYMLVTVLIGVFTGTLGAVAGAVVYHDLRVDKEGVNVDELIKVFE